MAQFWWQAAWKINRNFFFYYIFKSVCYPRKIINMKEEKDERKNCKSPKYIKTKGLSKKNKAVWIFEML